MTATIDRGLFGTTPAGEPVASYTMRNARGMEVRFIEYGGIIVLVSVPDRDGVVENVTLGYDTLDDYTRDTSYCGGLIGRYANRIARGRFSLDGKDYQLTTNDGPNHLHGGRRGFDKVMWRVQAFREADRVGASLEYTSPDGEEGYPGTVTVRCRYTLTSGNELVLDLNATTDRPTPINLTQHSYFNLTGAARTRDILDHKLTISASRFTPVDSELMPTGELRGVSGTPFDFRAPAAIGARIAMGDAQTDLAGGYDHNYVLDRDGSPDLMRAARLEEPGSGRALEILTTEPGLQFYSGNGLDRGTTGGVDLRWHGLALEPQHFPDSPNQPGFPSTLLRPGEQYRSTTIYRFTTA